MRESPKSKKIFSNKYFFRHIGFLLLLLIFLVPFKSHAGDLQCNNTVSFQNIFALLTNNAQVPDRHFIAKKHSAHVASLNYQKDPKVFQMGVIGLKRKNQRGSINQWENRTSCMPPFEYSSAILPRAERHRLSIGSYGFSGQPYWESTAFNCMPAHHYAHNNLPAYKKDKSISRYESNADVMPEISKRFIQSAGSTAARTTIGLAGGVFIHAGLILGTVMYDHSRGDINTDDAKIYASLGLGSTATDYGTDIITTYALAGTAIGSEIPVIGNFAGLIGGSIIGTGVYIFGNVFYKKYKMKINQKKQSLIAKADTAFKKEYDQKTLSMLTNKAKTLEQKARLLLAASMNAR